MSQNAEELRNAIEQIPAAHLQSVLKSTHPTERYGLVTAVYLTARLNNPGCLKLLIAEKADLEKPNQNGETPVFAAAFWNHTSCLQLLLAAGANPNPKNNEGISPFTVAKERNNAECFDLLFETQFANLGVLESFEKKIKLGKTDPRWATADFMASLWDELTGRQEAVAADITVQKEDDVDGDGDDEHVKRIRAAIQDGAPKYNAGKIKECADAYTEAMRSLILENTGTALGAFAQSALAEVEQADPREGGHDRSWYRSEDDRRSWKLRKALDQMLKMKAQSRDATALLELLLQSGSNKAAVAFLDCAMANTGLICIQCSHSLQGARAGPAWPHRAGASSRPRP